MIRQADAPLPDSMPNGYFSIKMELSPPIIALSTTLLQQLIHNPFQMRTGSTLSQQTYSNDAAVSKGQNSKPRVAVLSMYNGTVNRGVESWSLQVCRHLSSLGHQCTLIQGGEEFAVDEPFDSVSVHFACPDRYEVANKSISAKIVLTWLQLGMETAGFAIRCLAPLSKFGPDIIIVVNCNTAIVAAAQIYRC